MAPKRCVRISSFGSLFHFNKKNKPKEAGDAVRCMECPYEQSCAYSAKKIYYDPFVKNVKKNMKAILEFNLPEDSYVAFDATSLRDLIVDRLIEKGVFSDQIFEVEDKAIISMYEKEDAKKYLVA